MSTADVFFGMAIPSPLSWSRKWKCKSGMENKQLNTISTISEVRNSICNTNPVRVSLSTVFTREKTPGIPKRIIFVLLGFIGLVSAATMRYNLSIAIVAMVQTTEISDASSFNQSLEACPELIDIKAITNSPSQIQRGEFDWNPELQQLSLAAFYIGYLVVQFPASMVSEKYYAKHFFGFGILLITVATLLSPVAARCSIWALIAVRIIQGCGQAVTIPAMNTLIGRWIPLIERSRATAFIYSGQMVGSIISFPLSGLLCDSGLLGGWPSTFYVFGTFGLIWYVFWHFLAFESPEEHPYITKEEIDFISMGKDEKKAKKKIPWRSILTSLPVWSLAVAHFGYDWGVYSVLTETPIYLNNVLHYDLKQNGFLSSLPSIINTIVAISASVLTDKLRGMKIFKITTLRKIMNSIGFYGAGFCILCIIFVGCSPSTSITLLCLSMGMNGFASSGFLVTHVDMNPEYAGILMGITNTIGTLPGILAPIYVGWAIKDGSTLQNWGTVFITIFIVFVICGTIYNMFCSCELQPWKPENKQQSNSYSEEKTIPNSHNDKTEHL